MRREEKQSVIPAVQDMTGGNYDDWQQMEGLGVYQQQNEEDEYTSDFSPPCLAVTPEGLVPNAPDRGGTIGKKGRTRTSRRNTGRTARQWGKKATGGLRRWSGEPGDTGNSANDPVCDHVGGIYELFNMVIRKEFYVLINLRHYRTEIPKAGMPATERGACC
jgi:hypothetical protein